MQSILRLGTAIALCFGAINVAQATQSGGTIAITAASTATINPSASLIASGTGSDAGGSITVTSGSPLDTSGGQMFVARGGESGTGNGGSVTLSDVTELNVTAVVDVSPGSSSGAFTSNGGQLRLNGVYCQNYAVSGFTNTAITNFWDCADPDSITTTDEVPARWIASSSTIANVVGTIFPTVTLPDGNTASATALFVFANAGEFNIARQGTAATNAASGGATYSQNYNGVRWTYVNVFENFTGPNGYGSINSSQMTANTAHELGHALDNLGGNILSSNGDYVGTYLPDDETALNNDAGINLYDQGAGTSPCSTNNTAPFDGQPLASGSVTAETVASPSNAICNESTGTLTTPVVANNLTIAATYSPGVINNTNYLKEIFAEAFGWAAYGSTISAPNYDTSFFQKTADGLFLNGYYACTVAFAKQALTGTLTLPSYCH